MYYQVLFISFILLRYTRIYTLNKPRPDMYQCTQQHRYGVWVWGYHVNKTHGTLSLKKPYTLQDSGLMGQQEMEFEMASLEVLLIRRHMNAMNNIKPLLIELRSQTLICWVLVVVNRFECIEGCPCPQILVLCLIHKNFQPSDLQNLENFTIIA